VLLCGQADFPYGDAVPLLGKRKTNNDRKAEWN